MRNTSCEPGGEITYVILTHWPDEPSHRLFDTLRKEWRISSKISIPSATCRVKADDRSSTTEDKAKKRSRFRDIINVVYALANCWRSATTPSTSDAMQAARLAVCRNPEVSNNYLRFQEGKVRKSVVIIPTTPSDLTQASRMFPFVYIHLIIPSKLSTCVVGLGNWTVCAKYPQIL